MRMLLSALTIAVSVGCGASLESDAPASDTTPRQRKLPTMYTPTVTEQDLGAPIFPGSDVISFTTEIKGPGTLKRAEFATKSIAKEVEAFYREKLGEPDIEVARPKSLTFERAGGYIKVEISADEQVTRILIVNSPVKD